MLIERVDLKAFGRFTNSCLEFGTSANQFHLIYGENESGKSTSLRAIIAWLFGIDARTSDNYVHNYQELRVGGRLSCKKYGVFESVRRKGNSRTLKTPDESDDADESLLSKMLGNLDQDSFLRGFGLDRERLIAGGREIMRGEGDLGQILFAAGTGVNHLGELLKTLEQQQRDLFKPSGSNPELNKTLKEITRLNQELKSYTLTKETYQQRLQALADAKAEANAVGNQLRTSRQALARARNLKDARPLASRRSTLVQQLAELKDVPKIDAALVERRRTAETGSQVVTEQLLKLTSRIAEFQKRLAAIPNGAKWIEFGERINSLIKRGAAFDSASTTLLNLESRYEQSQQAIDSLLKELDLSPTADLEKLRLSTAEKDAVWKLIEQWTRLDEMQQSNAKALERIKTQLQSTATAEDEIPTDPIRMRSVLATHSNPQNFVEQNAKLAVELKRLEKRSTALHKKLVGFKGTIGDIEQLVPPTAESIASLTDGLKKAEANYEKQQTKFDETGDAVLTLSAEMEGFRGVGGIPSNAELDEIRKKRDQFLQKFISEPNSDSSEVLHFVAEADRIVDLMRNSADQVARRNHAERELIATRQRYMDSQDKLSVCTNKIEELKSQWKSIWREAGIDAESPAEMQGWLSHHENLIEICDQSSAFKASFDSNSQLIERVRATISAAILDLEPDALASFEQEIDVVVLHKLASELLDRQEAKHQQYKDRLATREFNTREIRRLQFESAQFEIEQKLWRTHWVVAIDKVAGDEDATIDQVRSRVTSIESLLEKHAQRKACQRERSQWKAEFDAFETEVREFESTISFAVGADRISEPDPVRVIERLKRDWQAADAAEKQRSSLTEQIRGAETEFSELEVRSIEHRITLESCCRELGCQRIEELPVAEQRAQDKQRWSAELIDVESQLVRLSDGEVLDSFCARTLESDPDELLLAIDTHETVITQTEPTLEIAQQSVGALQKDVDAMDGEGRAAEINQQIQDRQAKAARLARRYAVLAVQSVVLKQSIETYRDQHQGPILERATEIFSRLTAGDYHALKPYLDDKDNRILIGLRGSKNEEVRANLMSEGTADALFLSLRLAGLESHLEANGPMPLILDDILVQFDDTRSLAALRVLSEMGKKTQVIFFTHHQHLVNLLRDNLAADDFHIHQLGPNSL